MFLNFANFYKIFIKNFNKIAALLTSILQTTDKKVLKTQVTENKRNQDTSASIGGVDNKNVDRNIKNLLFIVKLAKSKKPIFAKANFFGTDFFTTGAKEAFIYLQKAFIETLILRHFDLECHIRIETDVLGYVIDKVFSQITLGQFSSNHVTYENYSDFLKFEIGQWYPVAFFSQKMIPAET